jgi:hypothetical protein
VCFRITGRMIRASYGMGCSIIRLSRQKWREAIDKAKLADMSSDWQSAVPLLEGARCG